MPNWFEENPTKSVIVHTILISASTWAASTFILQDNRLNLAKSELESQKTLTEQYKSKTELLQRDIDQLREENTEYKAWLEKTKDAIPLITPRILELKSKITSLESELNSTTRTSANPTKEISTSIGRAYLDETTGLIISTKKTTIERTALIEIKFPESETRTTSTATPGQQWKFSAKNKKYQITIIEILWFTDTVRFRIDPIP